MKKLEESREMVSPNNNQNVIIRKKCSNLLLGACPHCFGQIIACRVDLDKGILVLRKSCKDNCADFHEN